MERLSDLPLLIQNELRNDLICRATNKVPGTVATREEGPSLDMSGDGDAAYLLCALLFQGRAGSQDWNEAMYWLLVAARLGLDSARLDLPRVSLAIKSQSAFDIQDLAFHWLKSSILSYQDRFALDTIESIDPPSYNQTDNEIRKCWTFRPSSVLIRDDVLQSAFYAAFSEYMSFAGIDINSFAAYLPSLQQICQMINENLSTFQMFITAVAPETGRVRALRDYGNGLTWVHFAPLLGLVEVFQGMELSAEIANVQDAVGRTALYFSTYCGNSQIATLLLEAGAAASLGHDEKDNTCLHLVNLFKHEDIARMVQLFVQSGADVNAVNNKGETPIHRILQTTISSKSNHAAVSALLQHGVNVYLEDIDGETPHYWAVTIHQLASLKLLLDTDRESLSKEDYISLKTKLLDQLMFVPQYETMVFAGPEYPTCLDETIALLADEETVEAYKTIPDNGGDSVFFTASFRGATEVMKSLRKVCPFVNMNESESEYGRPAVCYAIRHGRQDVLDTLITLGADLFYRDNMQENALHAAAEFAPEMLNRLFDICRNKGRLEEMIGTESNQGLIPFDKAVINGHLDAARKLLDYGAKINEPRCRGAGRFKTTILGCILQIPTVSVREVEFLLDLEADAIVAQDKSTVFHSFAMRSVELQDEGLSGSFDNAKSSGADLR